VQLLRQYRKIFIFVTHDPRIALLSDFRIVMQGGGITGVLSTSDDERGVSVHVNRLDDALSALREKLRQGLRLNASELSELQEVA
jgi:ABC-type Fe3+/spermidine/putrescine transport system ATPase subunit